MTNEDLQQLKKLAESATPGPWERDTIRSEGEYGSDDDGGYGFDTYEVTDNTGLCIVDCLNNDNGCVEVGHDGHAWDEVAKHNAAFIAAANPATILALISKVESLAADAELFKGLLEKHWRGRYFNGVTNEEALEINAAMAKEKA